MPRNIEVKLPLRDPARTRAAVVELATSHPGLETQVDSYFRLDPSGDERVKLRDSDVHGLQLVRYHRPESRGVRASDYELTVLEGPDDPRLAELGEPVLVVTKRRDLFWVENVRVHLDEVEELGSFLELEAVVGPEHDDADCRGRVDALLEELGLLEQAPLRRSYSDLLVEAREAAEDDA